MRTQQADHCPRPSARTGPTTKEWSEAESGSPSLYASWGANRQTVGPRMTTSCLRLSAVIPHSSILDPD
ncbi:hypothetical protein G5714_005594 [Onychostoma macrolepis]|uniref:Uncharacterized protein n=1 Tax=Onychostoma macrolepis TaxID=369639 RepID=A0A7J6D1G2_9TELE|nr:hypothetical protein G5714_005594 [Onychostoma macrolepis]